MYDYDLLWWIATNQQFLWNVLLEVFILVGNIISNFVDILL